MKDQDINSLNHTTWRCQYHIVFVPKYRRMVIYNEIKADIGKILRQLCEQKGVEIISAEACPDRIHMLVSIPPKYSVSQIMGYLKGKSSLKKKRKKLLVALKEKADKQLPLTLLEKEFLADNGVDIEKSQEK